MTESQAGCFDNQDHVSSPTTHPSRGVEQEAEDRLKTDIRTAATRRCRTHQSHAPRPRSTVPTEDRHIVQFGKEVINRIHIIKPFPLAREEMIALGQLLAGSQGQQI